jgi:hypothetical protein
LAADDRGHVSRTISAGPEFITAFFILEFWRRNDMEKLRKAKEEFKLEFHFNEEGLFINGNNQGLSGFAKELLKAAHSEVGYHKHLNFSWKEMAKAGNLVINFDWIKKRLKLTGKNQGGFDVTIIKTEAIGDELWGKPKRRKVG